MKIHELSPADGSRRKRKRIGRGQGSGHGGTACRGNKGQKARSGGNVRRGFEGGQMPMQRRLPKRGFTNIFKTKFNIVNIKDLAAFESGTTVDATVLKNAGIINRMTFGVKLLGVGEISNPLTVKVDKVSETAKAKIEAAGGKVETV